MIHKVKTHKRPKFEYVLTYMLSDKERLLDYGGKPFVLTHNIKGKTIEVWAKQFREYEKLRTRKLRKDSILLYHEILSFSPRDSKNLTPEKIGRILREYIRLRNPNAGYVIAVHSDRDHIHAHVCMSAIDRMGKNMRLSRKALSDLKKNLQQFHIETFPELNSSIIRPGEMGRRRISDKERAYKQRTGKLSQRETVESIVQECFRKSKSADEFYVRLKEKQLATYVRGGKVYGVIFEKRKYRFKLLGVTPEKTIERTESRKKELHALRKPVRSRSREQSR